MSGMSEKPWCVEHDREAGFVTTDQKRVCWVGLSAGGLAPECLIETATVTLKIHEIRTTRWKNGAVDLACRTCGWSRSLPDAHSPEELREALDDARDHRRVPIKIDAPSEAWACVERAYAILTKEGVDVDRVAGTENELAHALRIAGRS